MSNVKQILKENAMSMINAMFRENIITAQDLRRFASKEEDLTDPEYVRYEMETWYRTLGIEVLLGHEFQLKKPFFTREELAEAYQNEEMVVCVPAGVNRKILAKLFHIYSWAIDDELVSEAVETEDFWFFTKATLEPEHSNKTGIEIKRIIEKDGYLGMTIERYIAFVARMRYLTGKTPDFKKSIWLTRGKYEGKSMLIAGFDSKMNLSIHAWLPQFNSPLCGVRYVRIVDHLYLD